MDTHTVKRWRRLVASATATLVVTLSVVVPLLDGDRRYVGSAFEAEHHGSSCMVVHDHTICTQFGANLALTPDSPHPERLPARVHTVPPMAPDRPSGTPLDETRLPRAPPFHRA